MKPILIHCHIYYAELWEELKQCILNVSSYPFELYVTMVEKHPKLEKDLLETFPKAHIEIVNNRGYDIGPFIQILNQINLDKYSYVIKLHTKRDMPMGALLGTMNVSGKRWREYALSFLKTPQNFDKVIQSLEQNKNLGMHGNYHLIMDKELQDIDSSQKAQKLLGRFGLENKQENFVAGTMFIARAELFKPVQKMKIKITDFETPDAQHQKSTLAHALERLFGYMIKAQGFEIDDVISKPQFKGVFWDKFRKLGLFLYRCKLDKKGYLKIRVCRIPVYTKAAKSDSYKKFSFLPYFLKKEKLTFSYYCHQITKAEFKKRKKALKEIKRLSLCKLGIAYNLFDGEELLEDSIKSIRSVASYVVVVWQKVSNFKEKANPQLESLLLRLKRQGLIDELYLYEPQFDKKDIHYNEKSKRNIGLKLCKRAGCDYFLSMDTDEFYHADQIFNALKYVYEHNIKSSAVSIVEYLKEPIYKIVNGYSFIPSEYGEDYTFYCPFIMKIHRFKKQSHSREDFPCFVDPSRGLNAGEKFYLFPKHIVAMHHMSTTRKDLAKKYQNSNLRRGYEDTILKELQERVLSYNYNKNLVQVSSFNGLYIQKVPNIFNIHISKGEQ